MYSSQVTNLLSRLCFLAHLFGSSPVVLNSDTQTLSVTSFGIYKSFLTWLFTTVYVTVFVPYQLWKMHSMDQYEQFLYLLLIYVLAICGVIALSILVFSAYDLVYMFNLALHFLKQFETLYMPASYNCELSLVNRNICNFLKITCLYQVSVVICLIGHYFCHPQFQFYLTTELSKHFLTSFIYMAFGLAYGWTVISICLLFQLGFFILLLYYFQFVNIYAWELRFGNSWQTVSKRKSVKALQKIENFVSVYRSIELIIDLQNKLLSVGLLPMQTNVWFLCIFCFLTLYKHGATLNGTCKAVLFLFSCGCLITWILILALAGHMTIWNQKTRSSWIVHTVHSEIYVRKRVKYMIRFKQSCRPISIRYENYFVVKPTSVLNFLKMTSRGVFKSIISLRDYS